MFAAQIDALLASLDAGDAADYNSHFARGWEFETLKDVHTAALEYAAQRGDTELLRHLLTWEESEAEPANDSSCALWEATRHGRLECARLLVEDGRSDAATAILVDVEDPLGVRIYDDDWWVPRGEADMFREVLAFLFESGALEFDLQLVVDRVQNPDVWLPGPTPLEVYTEAAMDAGEWTPADCFFESDIDVGYCGCELKLALPGAAAFMGWTGILARVIADPRTDPADVTAGWFASAWGRQLMEPINDECLDAATRKAVLEIIMADDNCSGTLLRRWEFETIRNPRHDDFATIAGAPPAAENPTYVLAVEGLGPHTRKGLFGLDGGYPVNLRIRRDPKSRSAAEKTFIDLPTLWAYVFDQEEHELRAEIAYPSNVEYSYEDPGLQFALGEEPPVRFRAQVFDRVDPRLAAFLAETPGLLLVPAADVADGMRPIHFRGTANLGP